MMKSLYTLGIIAAVLSLGNVAMAYPTLNGETGLFALPTANIAVDGSFVGATDLLFSDTNTLKARVVYGLSPRAEVGAALSSGIVDGISVTGKYRLTENQDAFSLAGGGSLTLADQRQSGLDLYLVGTQGFSVNNNSGDPLLCTFGVHLIQLDSNDTLRPFIGAQIPLAFHTSLIGEYQPKGGNIFKDPLTTLALRAMLTPEWSWQAGVSNATGYGGTVSSTTGDTGNTGTNGTTLRPFVGLQYIFTSGS